MPLQGGFALEEPTGELEQCAGMVPSEGKGRVNQGIGFDQGAIQIDAERQQNGVFERGSRSRQKECPSFVNTP